MAANITFSSQYLTATLNQSIVGTRFIAETGYIRRKGYYELNPVFHYKFFPNSNLIINHGPGVKGDMFFDHSFSLTDRETQFSYNVEWINKSTSSIDLKETFISFSRHSIRPIQADFSLVKMKNFHWNEIGGIIRFRSPKTV